jgi:hypothetical protein
MIARRLFVAFTGYKFLANLHSLGFRTFDSVIDESYDLVKNDTERYTQAFDQVKRLCAMDQAQVYNRIQDVLEHNYNLIMKTDWTAYAADHITKLINNAT